MEIEAVKSKIKLIISDLDKTLLPSRELSLSEELIKLIEELRLAGTNFAVASGRQYLNLQRLFYQVKDSVFFMPENGSWIACRDNTLYRTEIAPKTAMTVIDDILSDSSKEVLVSGKYTYYLNPRSEKFFYRMFNEVKASVTKVDDFSEIKEPIVKISAYDERGILGRGAEEFIDRWSGKLRTVVSGGTWVDFTSGDKGAAAEYLMQYLGVTKEETAVFGDDNNDIPMFKITENSWCIAEAEENVRKTANYTTHDAIYEIRRLVSGERDD